MVLSEILEVLQFVPLSIFWAPSQNSDMLWVIIPIYFSWTFAEFFQEKTGTSLGNAISNGVVGVWAGMDWLRTTNKAYDFTQLFKNAEFVAEMALSIGIIVYGIFIILAGVNTLEIAKYIGRIRQVTFVLVVFTPVIYNVLGISWYAIFSCLIYFPLFYYTVELLDKFVPNPKVLIKDINDIRSVG